MKVVVLTAHPDDECIGAGGTISWLAGREHDVHIVHVTDGSSPRSAPRHREASEAAEILGARDSVSLDFMGHRLTTAELSDALERFRSLRLPCELVLAPAAGELNQDHRIVNDLARILCRPPGPALLEYEVHRNTWWGGSAWLPSFYVGIAQADLERKVEAMQVYESELAAAPSHRSLAAIELEARYWGMRCGELLAEPFRVVHMLAGRVL